jgi:hypothetical protein
MLLTYYSTRKNTRKHDTYKIRTVEASQIINTRTEKTLREKLIPYLYYKINHLSKPVAGEKRERLGYSSFKIG